MCFENNMSNGFSLVFSEKRYFLVGSLPDLLVVPEFVEPERCLTLLSRDCTHCKMCRITYFLLANKKLYLQVNLFILIYKSSLVIHSILSIKVSIENVHNAKYLHC